MEKRFVLSPRRPGVLAEVVAQSNFLTEQEAAELLGRRRIMVVALVIDGALHPAILYDQKSPEPIEGVTRDSVLQEIEWRKNAGLVKRWWRRIKWLANWI